MNEKGKTRIFGLEPGRLGRLFSVGMNGCDAADVEASEPKPAGPVPREAAADPSSFAASLASTVEQVGQWIGPYHLVGVLGEGGMGIVYLAQQEHPIRRQVALKVIKPGMDSRRIIHRFRTEEQTLALLHHPNIAQVLDAGTTDTGRSYFVMEYVDGVPITDYCDRHALTVTDRLSLFQQVCHGIHHAHQKGIVHRDIKPSNVLVCVEQDMAIPKIIDFGIAKAINRPVSQQTLFTQENQPVGTPEFMSPEQLEMADRDIDIRSDIYSLGVLLYVLLTGVRPFNWEQLRTGGIDHIRRVIREQDPKTPSTRITRLGPAAAEIASCRRTEVQRLVRRLRRELEWIPLKAMRKERAARYRSAAELADDIDNYLRGRPLLAGPPTTIYRLRKFVRRHRALVAGIAAVLVVSLIGTLVSVTFAIETERAHADAEMVADFLRNDVLASVARAPVGEATVTYVLDTASVVVSQRFEGRPLVEASVHETLGATYRSMAESAKAEQHWGRALDIYQQHYGELNAATLRAMDGLYWVYDDQERHFECEALRRRMHAIRRRLSPKNERADLAPLAHTYCHLGNYRQAELLFDIVLEPVRRQWGDDYPRYAPMEACNLARVYAALARYEEADRLFARAFTTDLWGTESRWRLIYATDRANMYADQGRLAEAGVLLSRTLAAERRLLGDEHIFTLHAVYGLARVHTAQGRCEDAEVLLQRALAVAKQRLRPEHPASLRLVHALAVLRYRQGRCDEAESLFEQALAGKQRQLGRQHPETLDLQHDFGVLLRELRRYSAAEGHVVEAVAGRQAVLGSRHPHTIASAHELVRLYESWDKPEEAARWRARLLRDPFRDDDSSEANRR